MADHSQALDDLARMVVGCLLALGAGVGTALYVMGAFHG